MISTTSVRRLTAILFALGMIYSTDPKYAVEAQPRWTVLYGDQAHKTMSSHPSYEYGQQEETSPLVNEELMALQDRPEVTMLIVELAEALKQIRDEKYSRFRGFSRVVDDDNPYTVDEGSSSGPSVVLGNGEVGIRHRPLIPKRAHGRRKCGIFKICSPLRMKQN